MICGKIKKKFCVHFFFFWDVEFTSAWLLQFLDFIPDSLLAVLIILVLHCSCLSQLCKWKMRYLAKTVVVIFLLLLLFLSLLVLMIAFVSNVNICLLL